MARAPTTVGSISALFGPVQLRVLGLLFGQPDRRYRTRELVDLARSGSGAAHRQLGRLAAAGLVVTSTVGKEKYYQADAHSPLFADLRGLVVKTVGIVEPMRRALRPLATIRAAFVYGPIAEDILLVVVSSTLQPVPLRQSLAPLERSLRRPIHATILTNEAWRAWRSRCGSAGIVMVVGEESDLDLRPELP